MDITATTSIMEDYHPNKQTGGESPKAPSVEERQPEQSVSDLPSVGDASQNEKTASATYGNK